MSEFRKDDAKKPRLSLLPFDAIVSVVQVLEHGATRSGANTWEKCEDRTRYFDAAMRHLVQWKLATTDKDYRDPDPARSRDLRCAVPACIRASAHSARPDTGSLSLNKTRR